MIESNRKYRRNNLLVMTLPRLASTSIAVASIASTSIAVILVVLNLVTPANAALVQDELEGEFRGFCVGSSCDPHTLPRATPVVQPAESALLFSFSINFDEVTVPMGTGFVFLDVLNDQGEDLFRIKAERVPQPGQGGLALSLDYTISAGLVGSLPLGESVGGADCFWVERTPSVLGNPPAPGIRVTRTGSAQAYDTGNLHIMDSPTEVRQGVLELIGEPSGTVYMSDSAIGQKCGS
ncbi:MAG: hypothetical protein K0U98_28370 [Deltaproteobacteria bacterium]|nr:hypothetical protein [Deltaproteobacteria bacterium]